MENNEHIEILETEELEGGAMKIAVKVSPLLLHHFFQIGFLKVMKEAAEAVATESIDFLDVE